MLLRQNGRSLVVHAPAKLNLFLEVLGKRSDGFHELETLMVTVGMYDTLRFREESSGRVRLCCYQSDSAGSDASQSDRVPAGEDNLVMRAANLLRDYTGVDRGARIDLIKRIPIAAGLAGGSSDAAAALVALNRIWDLKLATSELQELASQLGSDIGFFLAQSSMAVCRGRGERIEPLNLAFPLHFVIVRPRTGLSTADVYGSCQPRTTIQSVNGLVDCLRRGQLKLATRQMHNALQHSAEKLNTEVTDLRTVFSKQPVLGHMMTGSGTAYFGVCANQQQARQLAGRLQASRLGRVFVVRSRR
jgi:4-diphosphocytidyl-2-C-methyl-D-erythritol kinase